MPGKYTTRLNDSQFSFIITPKAFHDFLEHNNLETKISHILGSIHSENKGSLNQAAKAVKKLILSAEFPKSFIDEILFEYKKFGGILDGTEVHISLLRENDAQRVKGDAALLHKIKEKGAELFEPHPSFDNPSIHVQVNSPVIKKLREFKKIEQKIEEDIGSIIHNSHYAAS
jgi:hypothetical protein